jgi:hypothetical protein
MPLQPAKKARVLEEKLKREKVRNRAIVGVTAMLGIAYVSHLNPFPNSLSSFASYHKIRTFTNILTTRAAIPYFF